MEGEIRLQNRPTNVICDSKIKELRLPNESGWFTLAASRPLLPGHVSGPLPTLHPHAPRRDQASLELLSNELLVVEVTQTLLLHQGALPLQRVLLPPRRLRHAHAQFRLGALQQGAHGLLVLELRDTRMLAWTGWGGGRMLGRVGRGHPHASKTPQKTGLLDNGCELPRRRGKLEIGVGENPAGDPGRGR